MFWGGYARHRAERVEAALRTWLAGPLASIGGQLARTLGDSVKGARALSHLALPRADACAVKHAYGLWDDEHRRSIYTRGFAWQVRETNPFVRHLERYASRLTDDPVNRAIYVDARTLLPDNTLVLAARAADVAGISIRYPFLDRQMVELATATPASLKQHGRIGMSRTAPHADTATALAPAAAGAAGTAAASVALRRIDDAGAQDAARPAVRRPGNRVSSRAAPAVGRTPDVARRSIRAACGRF